MTPDYRALCAELVELSAPVDSISRLAWRLQQLDRLANRARALLAEPEPEGPTDEELDELFTEIDQSGEALSWRLYARAALARWGRPTPQPVPLSERLPGPEDLAPWPDEPDASHWCWFGLEIDGGFVWEQRSAAFSVQLYSVSPSAGGATHWLPANALPTPEAND